MILLSKPSFISDYQSYLGKNMLLCKERKTSTLSFHSHQLWLKVQALLYFLYIWSSNSWQFLAAKTNFKRLLIITCMSENFHKKDRFVSPSLYLHIQNFESFDNFIFHLNENNGFRRILILKQLLCYTGLQYFTFWE